MKVLKSLIFYPMMWLRGIFLLAGKVLQVIFLLGAILILFAGQGHDYFWTMLLTFSGFSFFFFLLTHFYDQILLKLNPTGNDLLLMQ